ncbi:transporter substrate-binding protein [Consotaella aegiceratis]|uniref:transporter substrate-binding protein n=1 Tax=Consotaella aegiceratis TaxID=3097961 RepID=UPI002F42902A
MKQISIGILFSRSGGYELLAEEGRQGALAAVAAVNAEARSGLELVAVERDPMGRADAYATLCADILKTTSARHVIGCTTSWSRKEVIPVLERHGGLLWYPCPYEGFEANEHVVYTHACPNQHVVPLLAHIIPRFGANAFLVGSNYIWGWETNRLARELITDAGGDVFGERYLPIGDTDIERLVEEIRATRPNFILNNLIGPSSYAFVQAYAALGREDPEFVPARRPIVSCNLTEAELPAIGAAGEGHYSVGPYFRASPADGSDASDAPSSFFAAAYNAVTILAETIAAAGTDEPRAVMAIAAARPFATPMGSVEIDAHTQHSHLPVKIGRIRAGGFDIREAVGETIAPDPFLSRYDPTAVFRRPHLRVVS